MSQQSEIDAFSLDQEMSQQSEIDAFSLDQENNPSEWKRMWAALATPPNKGINILNSPRFYFLRVNN